jgi:hypothetical protein
MDASSKDLITVIALLDAAIRKIKIPPDELKRAKSKLLEYMKRHN